MGFDHQIDRTAGIKNACIAVVAGVAIDHIVKQRYRGAASEDNIVVDRIDSVVIRLDIEVICSSRLGWKGDLIERGDESRAGIVLDGYGPGASCDRNGRR